jgi:S-adenosylmethionine hydrolase
MIEPEFYQDCIGLLSDFGTKGEHYIASMKAIILKVNPNIQIIDISHNISSYSIIEASYLLKATYHYFPEFTVFIVVIDPGVGSPRKIVALKTKSNFFFIGADNGIFYNVLADDEIVECVMLTNENYFNKPISHTFHGRDIMAPVAAHIINGIPLINFGPSFNPEELVKYTIKFEVLSDKKKINAVIQYIDSFGNGVTNIPVENGKLIGTTFIIKEGYTIKVTQQTNNPPFEGKFTTHFAKVPIGSLLFLEGSSGFLEISINQGNAASTLGFKVGDLITFTLD